MTMITCNEAYKLAVSYQLKTAGITDLYNPRETDDFWIFSCGKPGLKIVGGSQVIVSKEDGMVSPLILPSSAGFRLLKEAVPVKEESA